MNTLANTPAPWSSPIPHHTLEGIGDDDNPSAYWNPVTGGIVAPSPVMEWGVSIRIPKKWYWVTDGESVWIAMYDPRIPSGWTNQDTWEDWGHDIIKWIKIPEPPKP